VDTFLLDKPRQFYFTGFAARFDLRHAVGFFPGGFDGGFYYPQNVKTPKRKQLG
jgi:hypothetical protein